MMVNQFPNMVFKVQDIVHTILKIGSTDYLMNRQTLGIPLRNQIIDRINHNLQKDMTYVLDFEGIYEISSSVADELGPVLFQTFLQIRKASLNSSGEIFLAYGNISVEVREALERTFIGWSVQHNSSFPLIGIGFNKVQDGIYNGFEFLGNPLLPSSLREVLDVVYQKKEITSVELEEKYQIKAASRKLHEINSRFSWLMRQTKVRIEATEKGWTYVYSPLLIPSEILHKENLE